MSYHKMRFVIAFLPAFFVTAEMCASRDNARQGLDGPPPTPVLSCSGFPGSAQWNACMEKWQKDMEVWQQQTEKYSQQQSIAGEGDKNDGADNSLVTDGWKIRTKGCSISSSSQNGHIMLQALLPEFDTVKADLFDSKVHTMKWTVLNKDKIVGWVKVTPPAGKDVEEVQYQVVGDSLKIWGPGASGRSNAASGTQGGQVYKGTASVVIKA